MELLHSLVGMRIQFKIIYTLRTRPETNNQFCCRYLSLFSLVLPLFCYPCINRIFLHHHHHQLRNKWIHYSRHKNSVIFHVLNLHFLTPINNRLEKQIIIYEIRAIIFAPGIIEWIQKIFFPPTTTLQETLYKSCI